MTITDPYTDLTNRELSVKAVDWCVRHGLTYRVECIDGVAGWRWDLSGGWPGRKYYHVDWRRIPAWLADRAREGAFLVRRFWVLRVLKLANPYEAALVSRRSHEAWAHGFRRMDRMRSTFHRPVLVRRQLASIDSVEQIVSGSADFIRAVFCGLLWAAFWASSHSALNAPYNDLFYQCVLLSGAVVQSASVVVGALRERPK